MRHLRLCDVPLSRQVGPFAYVRDLLVQLSGHSPPRLRC